MCQSGPPTEPTGFARLLGVNTLGIYFPEENKYVVEIDSLNREATNFFGTLHGGVILGLCDDFCGMLIYHKYGINTAVTIEVKSHIVYLLPVRPTSKLTFVCGIGSEMSGIIYLYVNVISGEKKVAEMTAKWHRR
ncbi:MAG: hypothetical protein A2406_03080 [Candidatus Komeilibacteria bacterium RIFOXYC1_FULL_37_11]|uniref:Thioesterase domain-containing protein n=1 Tax=Candidatus Komeilibacteria bacterium RIFOXYC1_FULL_37_11 TaxID=1798555 RepID=A0A1G2BZ03_9BACT|nr:MAG: hypothetical protein A2406_03080 [Candidatus Komeilibacteria bacterium RIFOXYC1_FULL_37_11]OGY95717.1 MAG: hypothetical protein A2611_02965 [Candidatus Komeilibacteria bacterium RIFOXYD1_FULL_37_29]OGY95941.1 MAG: hypothetical protein A2543_00300 [Candidatus Komeilibacteria bacterium RIFOXYD2_FULL_37_8]